MAYWNPEKQAILGKPLHGIQYGMGLLEIRAENGTEHHDVNIWPSSDCSGSR